MWEDDGNAMGALAGGDQEMFPYVSLTVTVADAVY
jgi:hypothetical protein